MTEQTQVLSMQMVSYEERLARAEADLRVERECRNALQAREVQLKEQITGFKLEIRDLMEDRKQKEQLRLDLEALNKRYLDSERTLEELGLQLSMSKLQVVDLKEKGQRKAPTSPDASGSNNQSSSGWTPDKMASECKKCNKEFSITRRKHHCRSCGQIFCNQCSDHVLPLPSDTAGGQLGKPVRVCDICWIQHAT